MNSLTKTSVLITLVVVDGLLIWFTGAQNAQIPTQAESPLAHSIQASQPKAPVNPVVVAKDNEQSTDAAAEVTIPGPEVSISTVDWEDRLDQILGADTNDKVKAQEILAVFPNVAPENQEAFAHSLSDLIMDEDYPALAEHLTNPNLPEAVFDVLLSDALNRPNALKLPVLLSVVRIPIHPKAAEARDLLVLYLEEDYGSAWETWERKIDDWLQENPD